ncbi:hypothetical protein BMF89_00140 [Arthrobacter sp. SRS-W-1-2016]|uniref:hypothetical protein n=1 Tax=Arthrobacter sp. SRS-W-1-2016 TaxID=1930254 RepID=UPI0009CC55B7|nr:hypothetical protein [Arthrobacter sp. SRS-W-1-2016]OOP65295.1 hypothetical protein BMF89_00140 [Arthrobacter sp. SRS-W-1-2016]
MVNTLLLLDIDGAVLPMRHPNILPAVDQVTLAVAIPPRVPASVSVRPAVIDAIKRWTVSGTDVQWLTSWGWRTKWLDQIGLPQLPIFYDPEPGEVFMWGRSGLSWKRPAVSEFLERQTEGVRLVWVDDDSFYASYGDELRGTYDQLEDLLLVQPDSFVGLTDEDLRRIDGFLSP